MVDIQLGNVQNIKQIDTASKLIVICNWTHIFWELFGGETNAVDDDERSRVEERLADFFASSEGIAFELIGSLLWSNNFSDKRFVRGDW